ncbi:MAG: hypothetical protein EDM79_19985, partial [Chloroflexi bacterium]
LNRQANSRTRSGCGPEQDGERRREENLSVNLFEEDGSRTIRRNFTPPKSDQIFSADYTKTDADS